MSGLTQRGRWRLGNTFPISKVILRESLSTIWSLAIMMLQRRFKYVISTFQTKRQGHHNDSNLDSDHQLKQLSGQI